MLDAAPDLVTLAAIPGNRLERVHRDREKQHSIRISDPWRICFEWKDGDACEVEITDYHREALTPKKRKPVHPGEILREEFMKPLGLSMNRVALDLRVPLRGSRISYTNDGGSQRIRR
jgi:RelE-like toxin of type II toxin-antitoxin system HigB